MCQPILCDSAPSYHLAALPPCQREARGLRGPAVPARFFRGKNGRAWGPCRIHLPKLLRGQQRGYPAAPAQLFWWGKRGPRSICSPSWRGTRALGSCCAAPPPQHPNLPVHPPRRSARQCQGHAARCLLLRLPALPMTPGRLTLLAGPSSVGPQSPQRAWKLVGQVSQAGQAMWA